MSQIEKAKSLDALLLLAGEEPDKSRTSHTVDLYKNTLEYRKQPLRIVVTGSHPGGTYDAPQVPDAQLIREDLVSRGIDQKDIYTETRALDTLGNIILSQPVIESALSDTESRKIGIVSDNHHVMRFMWAADRVFPINYEVCPMETGKILPIPQRFVTYIKELATMYAWKIDLWVAGIKPGDQKAFETYLFSKNPLHNPDASFGAYKLQVDALNLLTKTGVFGKRILRLLSREH
jgi:uncharacterized SAM-binding protein YcdF (DUF218 family)